MAPWGPRPVLTTPVEHAREATWVDWHAGLAGMVVPGLGALSELEEPELGWVRNGAFRAEEVEVGLELGCGRSGGETATR